MRKIKQVKMDREIAIPVDGTISYSVLVKRDEKIWYSCGEFIDNKEDALLYAASDDLLKIAQDIVEYHRTLGEDCPGEPLCGIAYEAGKAIARTRGEHGPEGDD